MESASPVRSAIPRVLGILMIVFGSLGALGMLVNLATGFRDDGYLAPALVRRIQIAMKVSSFVNLALAALDVYGGLALVRYRRNAVDLAQLYGLANILLTIAQVALAYTLLAPIGSLLGVGLVAGAAISVAWCVVVLALSNRPAARAACIM